MTLPRGGGRSALPPPHFNTPAVAYAWIANLKKGDVVEIALVNGDTPLLHNTETLAEDRANYLLQAGKRGVPAGGWPEEPARNATGGSAAAARQRCRAAGRAAVARRLMSWKTPIRGVTMRRQHRSRGQFTFLPAGCQSPGLDRRVRRATYDRLVEAKCPRCGAALVARVRRTGPYFHCQCLGRKAA